MMMFFTLLFILTNAYALIKGKLFYNVLLQSAENTIKKAKGEIEKIPNELQMQMNFIVFYMLFLTISEIIYIVNALKVDPNLFPTMILIATIFSVFLRVPSSKSDLTNEIGRARYLSNASKKYTFVGTITKLIYVSYYGYMFAVLTGLIK